ncbi:MAG: hypothetical protein JXR61_00265 [Prolixibacteraceae bacterium]|nr:hypothetical protein [Prolixibacteraceae bacterium]
MEEQSKNIVRVAERIIVQQGIEALSLNSLSNEPELKGIDIGSLLKSEEDIFLLLIADLEKDLDLLLANSTPGSISPETEFELFFKMLYDLFQQKPWYLPIIFYNNILERNKRINAAIKHIKNKATGYLTKLIDRGKKENVFATTENTQTLVKDILGSIRFLMNDLQLSRQVTRDLKIHFAQKIKYKYK